MTIQFGDKFVENSHTKYYHHVVEIQNEWYIIDSYDNLGRGVGCNNPFSKDLIECEILARNLTKIDHFPWQYQSTDHIEDALKYSLGSPSNKSIKEFIAGPSKEKHKCNCKHSFLHSDKGCTCGGI